MAAIPKGPVLLPSIPSKYATWVISWPDGRNRKIKGYLRLYPDGLLAGEEVVKQLQTRDGTQYLTQPMSLNITGAIVTSRN